MKKLKNKNGMTLLVLTITVVVLLILVGVTVKLAVDKNGTIEKAKEAVEKQNQDSYNSELEKNELLNELID